MWRGDSVEALRLFRRAENAAATIPERIIIAVDRAFLARESDYRAIMVEKIEHALDDALVCNRPAATAGRYGICIVRPGR